MTMSGSQAHFVISQGSTKIYDESDGTDLRNTLAALAPGATATFTVQFFDSAKQILPSGSVLSVTANQGTLDANDHTVQNTTRAGGSTTSFSITSDIDPATPGTVGKTSNITILLTTPKGIETSIRLEQAFQGT